MSNVNYYMSKETYYMPKETYYMPKETWSSLIPVYSTCTKGAPQKETYSM